MHSSSVDWAWLSQSMVAKFHKFHLKRQDQNALIFHELATNVTQCDAFCAPPSRSLAESPQDPSIPTGEYQGRIVRVEAGQKIL